MRDVRLNKRIVAKQLIWGVYMTVNLMNVIFVPEQIVLAEGKVS